MIIYIATNLAVHNDPIIIMLQNDPINSNNKSFQLNSAISVSTLTIFLLLIFMAPHKHNANTKHKITQSILVYINTIKKIFTTFIITTPLITCFIIMSGCFCTYRIILVKLQHKNKFKLIRRIL